MRLLVLDVEGTLFEPGVRLPGTSIASTMWQGIASVLGPEAVREEIETHARWERGEYPTYLDWMKDTIEIHLKYGLSKDAFDRLIDGARYNSGVPETLLAVDRSRWEPVLISGGFRELARRPQVDFSIKHALAACEYLFDERDALRSYNLLPCDFDGKIDFIHLMLREYGLGGEAWVFVGDGLNDVPIARTAPVSIGYRAHPELRSVSTHNVEDFAQSLEILSALGDER